MLQDGCLINRQYYPMRFINKMEEITLGAEAVGYSGGAEQDQEPVEQASVRGR